MAKYGNKKTSCLSKHVHDSKFEATYCDRLLALVKRKEIQGFIPQYTFPFLVNECPIGVHIVDFLVFKKGWTAKHGNESLVEAHEVKGFRTAVWQLKRKLFKACYPTVPYIVISKGRS